MDDINKLLETTGLLSLKESGISIVSLYGVSEAKDFSTVVTLANNIVGSKVFVSRHERNENNSVVELAEGLQFYLNKESKTVYLFMDSNINTTDLVAKKSFPDSIVNHQSTAIKGLLFMLTISHLVIPILPPTFLPADFLSTLVTLAQVKANMHTHLAQYQSSCWKHWDIAVPNGLFEKKENERMNPALMGWWGPAKGVPILVFVIADVRFGTIAPATIKKAQESLQMRIKNLFRALHLMPAKQEGGPSHPPVENRSLFVLPSTSQSIIHIVPAVPDELIQSKKPDFSFGAPLSISSYLDSLNITESPSTALYHEYSDKLLKNFVSIWTKTALTRHPFHNNFNNRKSDIPKTVPLPTGVQFASAAVSLLSFMFNQPITEDGVEFKKIITAEHPSTKGMIQQIEVILRKKIRDNLEIERVFSKSHSIEIMQKCNESYLQDLPPFYTEKYHQWKKSNVMRMYRSLARGPCMEEYAARLERECDNAWKGGRQSCEAISLTGKACRLKIGHENETLSAKQLRDERAVIADPAKHSSGLNFLHACDCGKSQRVRDDPFEIEDANINFYKKFGCCLCQGRAALNIPKSTFGKEQHLVLEHDEVPPHDTALIYLGPSGIYKNNVGLDKMEGFMNNTNFLIPWSITTINELKMRQQEAVDAKSTIDADTASKAVSDVFLRPSIANQVPSRESEWPVLGKAANLPKASAPPAVSPVVPSFEAFPALGSNATPVQSAATTSTPVVNTSSTATAASITSTPNRQLFDTRRRKNHRSRDKVQGLIRGYVGAEYECPHGHRFLSCGEGRVCKLGHTGHPKEHGNYFVHQDLPIYVICPCTYANNVNGNGATSNGAVSNANMIEITAQLQRLYIVTPEEAITISIEPKIKINIPGTDKSVTLDLDIKDSLSFGPGGTYVYRLPFVYRDAEGNTIPMEMDVQKRLKSATLQKDCIKFHYTETEKWETV